MTCLLRTRVCRSVLSIFTAAALAAAALLGTAAAAQTVPGFSVDANGVLLRDGAVFRGIGVNYYNAFYRTIQDPTDTSYRRGFQELGDRDIPFARVMGTAFKRLELNEYLDNRDSWFARMDDVIKHAGDNNVGVILCLFWNVKAVPNLQGEPLNAWGDSTSETRAFARTYARDVIARYADNPTVVGWEFCNEFNLKKDLPANLGTNDEIDSESIWNAMRWFADEVERLDPGAMVSSGNAIPRVSANELRRFNRFSPDTRGEFRLELRKDNPGGVDTLSIHAYFDFTTKNRFGLTDGADYRDVIREAMSAAATAKKPLFIGEFGVRRGDTDDSFTRFTQFLDDFDELGVQIAALWVYDFNGVPGWNVRWDNGRAWQLREIEKKNAELAAQ